MVEGIELSRPPVRRTLTIERLRDLRISDNPNEILEILTSTSMPLSTLQVLSGVPVTVEPIGSAREEDISVNSDPFIQTRSG